MRQQLRAALIAYAALWALTLVGAAAGALTGGATGAAVDTRTGWGLWGEVVVTNLRLVASFALAALMVQWLPAWRFVLDSVVAALALVSPLAVGAAVGAGGPRLAETLVHLPFEWAALAWGMGLYAAARTGELTVGTGTAGAVVAATLVVVAAVVEGWLQLG